MHVWFSGKYYYLRGESLFDINTTLTQNTKIFALFLPMSTHIWIKTWYFTSAKSVYYSHDPIYWHHYYLDVDTLAIASWPSFYPNNLACCSLKLLGITKTKELHSSKRLIWINIWWLTKKYYYPISIIIKNVLIHGFLNSFNSIKKSVVNLRLFWKYLVKVFLRMSRLKEANGSKNWKFA